MEARARGMGGQSSRGGDWLLEGWGESEGWGSEAEAGAVLRERLMTALHLGWAREGDRLPSIREVARAARVPKHAVSQAYARLEEEGLVEKRARSGVYVAAQPGEEGTRMGETAEWLANVLTEACAHRIRVPYLPELIERWTAAVRLRACCIEGDEDTRAALVTEVRQQFGLDAISLDAGRLPRVQPEEVLVGEALPRALRQSDIVVTTTFHAGVARRAGEVLGKPVVVAMASPDYVAAIEERIREASLTVVCVDTRFGERVRRMFGGSGDRVRTVLAVGRSSLRGADLAEPILLTRAAHERLGYSKVRLIHPLSGTFCASFARQMARAVIQLNLRSTRM